MFRVLTEERELPDLEFFVNRRDFPLLKRDGTEPYSNMFNSTEFPLVSHKYEKYCPILSMVTTDSFADIPIPTGDDWSRVCQREKKYFPDTCNRSFEIKAPEWEKRKPIAMFRGSSTGCGTTIETNMRLKLAYMSFKGEKDKDGLPLLDAGITGWNLRPRKLMDSDYLQTIDIKALPFSLAKKMTPQEQAEYKYVINVDGHVSAFRLSLELEAGMCVLLVDSDYKMWYRSLLKPYVHYIPVKRDLSDLLEQIRWCKENDAKCKKISEEAEKFARKYLSKDGMLDYLQKLLFDLKKVTGTYIYNQKSIIDIQREEELIVVNKYDYPNINKSVKDLTSIPKGRSYSLLKGVEWMVNLILDKDKFENVAKKSKDILKNERTNVEEWEIKGYKVVRKTSINVEHEVFVAKKCTNELLKMIPNFGYVFGKYDNHVVMEKINGNNLFDYIKSPEFKMEDYIFILLQVALTLHIAQKMHGFVHNDVAPWNIIIQKLPKLVPFDYPVSHNKVYRVKTQLIPVLIDMGRSHIISDNQHYGVTNIFSTSTIQDILQLLLTSIYEISNFPLIKKDTDDLIMVANFIAGNKYREKKFSTLGDIKYFMNKNKKYSQIINSDKYDLEEKTPLMFVEYILEHSEYKFNIQEIDKVDYSMNRGNPRQVFEYMFSSTMDDKVNSFLDVFRRIYECDFKVTNKFFSYYTLYMLEDTISSVKDKLLEFLKENKMDTKKYLTVYDKAIKKLEQHKENIDELEAVNIKYEVPLVNVERYDEDIFTDPKRLLSVVETSEMKGTLDICNYKDIIEGMMLNKKAMFTLPWDEYEDNFKNILDINSVKLKTEIANVVSVRKLAGIMSKTNVEYLEREKCPETRKILKVWKKISELEK
jgi:serine/threonine protein kinase